MRKLVVAVAVLAALGLAWKSRLIVTRFFPIHHEGQVMRIASFHKGGVYSKSENTRQLNQFAIIFEDGFDCEGTDSSFAAVREGDHVRIKAYHDVRGWPVLDPEWWECDEAQLEALIDGSELSAWARILSLLVSNDETFPIELVGEWSSFQSEGNLDHPSTRADGFIDTVRIDADGTFELTRADETSLLGRWSTDPLSLRSEDARIDVDWIPSMPALLLEVDGTLLAFAPAPLARELARFADAYYADTEA